MHKELKLKTKNIVQIQCELIFKHDMSERRRKFARRGTQSRRYCTHARRDAIITENEILGTCPTALANDGKERQRAKIVGAAKCIMQQKRWWCYEINTTYGKLSHARLIVWKWRTMQFRDGITGNSEVIVVLMVRSLTKSSSFNYRNYARKNK